VEASNKYKVLLHVAGWVIFFILPLILLPLHEFTANLRESYDLVLTMAIRNVLWMGLFYLNLLYFTPILLKRHGVGIFLLTVVIGIFIITVINSRVHHFFAPPFNNGFHLGPPPDGFQPGPPRRPLDFDGPFFPNLAISIVVVSVSTSVVLWSDWVKAKADETERAFRGVAAELAVLKLQISPHFLFNTLNNIRWLVRSKSDLAETAVVKLSSLLRYIVYQVNLEKVSLEREIEHLRGYIDLQQMRLVNTNSLIFSATGDTQEKVIVPLLLIPIVENVFKYGDFSGSFQNEIHLRVTDYFFNLTTVNMVAKLEENTENEHGIGLVNVKRRLSLHYPEKHILRYSEENGVFKLELEILLS
jgi:hypothetical protein